MKVTHCLVAVVLSAVASKSIAIGEAIFENVIRSDFVFDRRISNTPFFPIGYLSHTRQNALTFDGVCTITPSCEIDYRHTTQGLGIPLWVGQKNMFILGETLTADRLTWAGNETIINTGGVLAAWVAQPTPEWQAGAFAYGYTNIGDAEFAVGSRGLYAGVAGRYRHNGHFHSYWGLVYNRDDNRELYLPYISFDWYLNREWSISAVLPWPAVNYAPSEDYFFRFGILAAGVDWSTSANGELNKLSFGKLDFGLSFEHRLHDMVWGEIAVGRSGLGRLVITDDGDFDFESEVDGDGFVRFSINIRPDA